MMFTYGHVTSEEELKEAAVELLEKTKPENNVYIRGWKSRGVEAESAFFTQGLLQLTRRTCFLLCPSLLVMQMYDENLIFQILSGKIFRFLELYCVAE